MENNDDKTKPNYNKEELEKVINFLEQIDLKKYHLQTLDKYLEEQFPILPVGLVDIPKGTLLFRGRIHEGGPSYTEFKDFSYVEKAKCQKFGRANFINQSLFYASDTLETAQMEVISKEIDTFQWPLSFGVWEVKEDIIMANILPYSEDKRV